MSDGKIVLTGATGHLGSHVLKNLLRFDIAPSRIRISSSNPSYVPDELKAQGLEIVHGTYDDPTTLDTAFANAGILLLVSHPSFIHEHRVRVHKSAIDAAVRAGVKHVVYTSLAFDPEGSVAVMAAHTETERYLKDSGLRYTIVREGIYSAAWKLFFGFFSETSPDVKDIYIPGDGPIAWVNWEDLGEGTAKLILDCDQYVNATVSLTGSKTISLTSIADRVSKLLDRQINLHIVPEQEWIDRYKHREDLKYQFDNTEEFLRYWATTYIGLGKGECALVDPLLEILLGRKQMSFDEDLRRSLVKV